MSERHEIDSYLQQLDSKLCGSSRYRTHMLVEIRTHLCDISDEVGCSAIDAVERFGDTDQLARQLNQVVAAKRRRSLGFVGTGIAAAAAVALAAGGIPGTGHGSQLAAPQNATTRQPIAVGINPKTGMIVATRPLSRAVVPASLVVGHEAQVTVERDPGRAVSRSGP